MAVFVAVGFTRFASFCPSSIASVITLPASTRVVSNAARCAFQIVRAERRAVWASSVSATRAEELVDVVDHGELLAGCGWGRPPVSAIAARALTLGSERRKPVGDGLALAGIRRAPGGGLEILGGMARIPGRRRMTVTAGSPSTHLMNSCAALRQPSSAATGGRRGRTARSIIDAFRKRAVDEHGDAKLARERQEARAGFRLGDANN